MKSEHDRIIYHRLSDRERRELLEKLARLLAADDRVRLALAFGSVVRERSARDLDVAVYAVPHLAFDDLLELGSKIELELGIPIDLVQLQDLDPAFRLKVLKQGYLLMSRKKMLRFHLISQAFSNLQDMKISEKF